VSAQAHLAALAPSALLVGSAVSSIVGAVLRQFTTWVSSGAADIVTGVGRALDASTQVPLGSGFHVVYDTMRRVGFAFALPFLAAAVIQAVLRQDLGMLGRTVGVRLPCALVLSGAAIWVVQQSLVVTDALSAAMLDSSSGISDVFLAQLATMLVGPVAVVSGFAGFLVAILAAIVAFVLWLELVIRSAAVAVAALFIPLALAGAIWPATGHWIRRLAETMGALVLSKFAIAAILALAIVSLGDPVGVPGLIEGIALLLLATFAPFALLRLLPFFEAGATAQLEGMSRRAYRALRSDDAARVGDLVASRGSSEDDVDVPRAQIADLVGSTPSGPGYDAIVADIYASLEERARGDEEA